jgi:hypothetical protein
MVPAPSKSPNTPPTLAVVDGLFMYMLDIEKKFPFSDMFVLMRGKKPAPLFHPDVADASMLLVR